MLDRIKEWFRPRRSDGNALSASGQGVDQYLVALGEYRARLYDLSGKSTFATEALQHINTLEQHFSQIQRLRVERLNPDEILAQRLASVESDLTRHVLARFKRLCELLQLSAAQASETTSAHCRELIDANAQTLTQLEQIIQRLINFGDDAVEDKDLISRDVASIVKVLEQVAQKHK